MTPSPLSATSALVLLWAGDGCYPSPAAKRYLAALDLEAGRGLLARCEAVWPHYAEVIRNRKWAVLDLMEKCRAEDPALRQVVVAGAGLAPLGVEWAFRHPGASVLEVDRSQMPLKARLAAEAAPGGGIRFVEADLADAPGVRAALVAEGWDCREPTLLVLEGISYFLTRAALAGLVGLVRNAGRRSRIVLEYLVPPEGISPERRAIPDGVFGIIAGACGLGAATRYACGGLRALPGVRVRRRLTMREMERRRTGENRHFPSDAGGWIEVCLLEC